MFRPVLSRNTDSDQPDKCRLCEKPFLPTLQKNVYSLQYPPVILLCMCLLFVLDTLKAGKSSGGDLLESPHRNPTSPPSLWPGRELRKYHCPCTLSSPGRKQSGPVRLMDRSLQKLKVMALAGSGLCNCNTYRNVPDEWVFSFQGTRLTAFICCKVLLTIFLSQVVL